MIQIVCDPGRQQLPECHGAELRMGPGLFEIGVRQRQRSQRVEIGPARRVEVVEELPK